MKLACPHCSQTLELTPEVLASLQGQPHFECPSCQGLIALPDQRPMPRRSAAQAGKAAMQTQRGMNRNLLVLGVVALVVLGGIAAFLAARNIGSITNIFQNTTNNIIHNSYFTQLIASGATTMEDLQAIAEIRPYGDGFIGVSKESLSWEHAQDLARRTGASLLSIEFVSNGKVDEFLRWFSNALPDQTGISGWVFSKSKPATLESGAIKTALGTDQARQAVLHWFNPGPMVFEESFAETESLRRTHLVEGQYSRPPSISRRLGLEFTLAHHPGMVWPLAALGDSCRAQFEVRIPPQGNAVWVLHGAGLGNSLLLGTTLTLGQKELVIHLGERELGRHRLLAPLAQEDWTAVQTDVLGKQLAVRIRGTLVCTAELPTETDAIKPGWLGLSGSKSVVYRNVKLWSSEADQSQQPELLPAETLRPSSQSEELFHFSEPDGALGGRWSVHQPEHVRVEDGTLRLSAYHSNGWPSAFLTNPFHGPVAVEFTHVLDSPAPLNLTLLFAFADAPPSQVTDTKEIWQVALPDGQGAYRIRHGANPGKSSLPLQQQEYWKKHFGYYAWATSLAATARYAPLQGRPYRVRVEFSSKHVRIFLNGRFLLEAERPPASGSDDPKAPEAPFYLGFQQFYSSSLIGDIRVFRLNNE